MSVPRLNRGKIIALERLLNMMYRPAEVASEVGISVDALYRSYIPAGAPVEFDGKGRTWIHGTAFARWAREYLATTRRGKRKAEMTPSQGYCLRCNQVVEMLDIRRRPHTEKAGTLQVSGRCPTCDAKVNRFMRSEDYTPVPRAARPARVHRREAQIQPDGPMVHRQNWLDVQAYLEYQLQIAQVDPKTARSTWCRLRHLIEWAGERPFAKASTGRIGTRATFPAYAELLRNDQGKPLSASHLAAMMKTARAFLGWAREQYPTRYKTMDMVWVRSLRPSRARGEQATLIKREIYTLEEVLTLVRAPAATTAQRRIRAAVAMLFLSGMRIGAFTSLTLQCVDLPNRRILQLPELGVHTKNSKAAETWLLNIPELLGVVQEWDDELRANLPETGYWYAQLSPWGEMTTQARRSSRGNVRGEFGDHLRDLCERAGVPYLSAHKFRHGHAVYGLKRAQTVAQMKAISQNLMHSNMGITDGIYGKLVNDDVKNFISGL